MIQKHLSQLQIPPLGFDLGPILGQSGGILQVLKAPLIHDMDIVSRILRLSGAAMHKEHLQMESLMFPAPRL